MIAIPAHAGKDFTFRSLLRPVRIVEITDPRLSTVVAFSSYLVTRVLYEWWLLPMHHQSWTEEALTATLINSPAELEHLLRGVTEDGTRYGQLLQSQLVAQYPGSRLPESYDWHIETREIPEYGTVVRIIFGDPLAMRMTYAAFHLNERYRWSCMTV